MGNHVPYGITISNFFGVTSDLPTGSGDFPTFIAAEADTQFSDPSVMTGSRTSDAKIKSNVLTTTRPLVYTSMFFKRKELVEIHVM